MKWINFKESVIGRAWRDFWTSKEVVLLREANARLSETNEVLEEELARAQSEIRQLVNAALSEAGRIPLPGVNEQSHPIAHRSRKHLTLHQRRRMDEVRGTRHELEDGKELMDRALEKIARESEK